MRTTPPFALCVTSTPGPVHWTSRNVYGSWGVSVSVKVVVAFGFDGRHWKNAVFSSGVVVTLGGVPVGVIHVWPPWLISTFPVNVQPPTASYPPAWFCVCLVTFSEDAHIDVAICRSAASRVSKFS